MSDIRYNNEFCIVRENVTNRIVISELLSGRVETLQQIEKHADLSTVSATYFPVLPTSGWVEQKMYNYNGKTVLCIQAHNRTIYAPDQTPALFSFYRTDTGLLDWIVNEKIVVDTVRIYMTIKYKCIQSHITIEGLTPDKTPALWVVVATSSAWTIGVSYKVNDPVNYLGNNYKCLQAHTSQAGWNPVAAPALWNLI